MKLSQSTSRACYRKERGNGIRFYICGLIAILATLRVVTHTNPVHALLYLIISLLAIAGVFFSLGAYFAGALEIIVYAGAIMVLFVFVVMMLNRAAPRSNRSASGCSRGSGLARPSSPRCCWWLSFTPSRALTTVVSTVRQSTPKKWALRCLGRTSGGGAGLHAAAGGHGGCLPHWPRRARRRGAEQPSERQRQTKTEEHA
nr:NADH-quinone oxidoreductase subunit J [Klebsiella pneumoniae]